MVLETAVVSGVAYTTLNSPPRRLLGYPVLHGIAALTTVVGLAMSTYIILIGTHCCIWASSCALRTTGGVESLRKSTKFLRQKQRAFFSMFCAVVLCFFLSSLVHVYSLESAERLSTVPRVILTVVFVCGLALAFRLHKQFRHNRKSAKLVVIEDGVGDIGDLDEHAAQHWQRLVHASFHKAQFNPKWWPL